VIWFATALIPFLFGLLATLKPYRPPAHTPLPNLNQVRTKYDRWEAFAILPLFTLIPLFTFGLGSLLHWFNGWLAPTYPGAAYHLQPSWVVWLVPGLLLAFELIKWPMDWLYTWLLKGEYATYKVYTNLKHGFDGEVMYRYLTLTMGGAATVVILLLFDYSAILHPDRLEYNRFGGLGQQTYIYNEVAQISYVQPLDAQGRPQGNPFHRITFADGPEWSTSTGLSADDREAEMIQWLARKATTQVDTVREQPGK
jgi:hypothetical protein